MTRRFILHPHPDQPLRADIGLSVGVTRKADILGLCYQLRDPAGVVALPLGTGKRTDELWKHTCFEAFVRSQGGTSYTELNFSPGGDWAAYAFKGYRAGGRDLVGLPPPSIERQTGALSWRIRVAGLPDGDTEWVIGLSAVIELVDGSMSYWAIAHQPVAPDFHHAGCFVATLAPGNLGR